MAGNRAGGADDLHARDDGSAHQLLLCHLTAFTKIGQPIEKFAAIFPFSSPFAMIGRAALEPTLWHHGVAIIGQIFFAILLLRLGVYLFKKNVMKSGSAGRVKGDGKRKLFGLIAVRG